MVHVVDIAREDRVQADVLRAVEIEIHLRVSSNRRAVNTGFRVVRIWLEGRQGRDVWERATAQAEHGRRRHILRQPARRILQIFGGQDEDRPGMMKGLDIVLAPVIAWISSRSTQRYCWPMRSSAFENATRPATP